MILPIRVYGDPILRAKASDIEKDSPELQQLIDDMIETMQGADGVGLAATQVGRMERVFVVDLTTTIRRIAPEKMVDLPPQPMACLNPEIVWESEDVAEFEEGCLSIPDLNEVIERPNRIILRYLDRSFQPHQIEVDGILASIFQHEYDHLEGILYIDYLSPVRRRLLKRRLQSIARGEVEAAYPLAVPAR